MTMINFEIESLNQEELRNAINFRLLSKTLKRSGINSVIFGILAIYMGFGGIKMNPLNAILGLIGVFLLVEGVWIFSAPTPKGMIMHGVALVIVGSWNILITIASALFGGSGDYQFFAILGVWQIILGIQRFNRYAYFSTMPTSKPSDSALMRIDDFVKTLNRTKARDQSDIVEFQTTTFVSPKAWKGRLLGNSAVFVERSGYDIVFAPKTEVDFDRQGKVLLGKTLKVSIRISDLRMNGSIAPKYFERFEQWKLSA